MDAFLDMSFLEIVDVIGEKTGQKMLTLLNISFTIYLVIQSTWSKL